MFGMQRKCCLFRQLAAEKKTQFWVDPKQIFGPSYFVSALVTSYKVRYFFRTFVVFSNYLNFRNYFPSIRNGIRNQMISISCYIEIQMRRHNSFVVLCICFGTSASKDSKYLVRVRIYQLILHHPFQVQKCGSIQGCTVESSCVKYA